MPEVVERKEKELDKLGDSIPEDNGAMKRLSGLRKIPYTEVIALVNFIDDHTPFSTKHGVKGAEFENVFVIAGRGWNLYNFNEFLEWSMNQTEIPSDRRDKYERNRNLFYVVSSRPKKRLAFLFTQKLSEDAMATLTRWFGWSSVESLMI